MSIQGLFPNTAAILQALGGANLTSLLGAQQPTAATSNPLAALLGLGQQQTTATPTAETLLAQYLGIGSTIPQPPVPTEAVTLPTYDVNFIRQLGDDAAVGGNGDGVLKKAELQKAATLLTQLNTMFGQQANATFKSIFKTVNLLLDDNVAKQISSKDGKADGISAQDIVTTANSDADAKLETIIVNRPVGTTTQTGTNNILEQIIKQLLGLG